jgi:hypothetical protein
MLNIRILWARKTEENLKKPVLSELWIITA